MDTRTTTDGPRLVDHDDQLRELRERGRSLGTATVLAEPHTFWN